jgi:hypothetical protein
MAAAPWAKSEAKKTSLPGMPMKRALPEADAKSSGGDDKAAQSKDSSVARVFAFLEQCRPNDAARWSRTRLVRVARHGADLCSRLQQ